MRLRKRYLPLAAILGAAVVVLPGALAAAPSEVKLEVNENCNQAAWPCWNAKGSDPKSVNFYAVPPFTIAQGGTISFEDNGMATDVIWKGAAPSCTSGVPEGPPTKTGWSGTCTFATAGEYEFESEGLFNDGTSNYTKYKVIVEKPSGTTGTTGTTTTTTTTSPTTPSPTPVGTSPTGSPFSGAPSIHSSQRGTTVKGSLQIAKAGAGDRLEVDLIATTASLAKAGHKMQVVGRFVSASVSAGQQPFSVKLDAKARKALKRHHRLALKVRITLTPVYGEATSITRSVTLHA